MKTENVEEVLEALKSEIRIMECLDHPNIVKYLGHDLTCKVINRSNRRIYHRIHIIGRDKTLFGILSSYIERYNKEEKGRK
jgi:hypothetical protein